MSTWLERLWYPAQPESGWRQATLSPLALAELAFRGGVALRGALFDHRLLASHRVGVRVVSIGNLNVGGAGKTPVTMLVANRLREAGERVVVLSRGYGRSERGPVAIIPGEPRPTASAAGDEPLLISDHCPGVTVLVGADRVALARRAVQEHSATVLVLDDGLQHRRLARDVDLVVIDGGAQFGNRHLMPRGPLREPISALRRATLACVRLLAGAPTPALQLPIPAFVTRYSPAGWRAPDGSAEPVAALAGREVVLLTAIARPSSVEATVRGTGARISRTLAFADHHAFSEEELRAVKAAAGSTPIVTTEKDRVRLPPGFATWTLRMELRIEQGEALLDQALRPAT